MIRIRLELGAHAREYAFHRPQIRIGRSPANDLAVPTHALSARHATLAFAEQGAVCCTPHPAAAPITLLRPEHPPLTAQNTPLRVLPGDTLLLGPEVRLTLLAAQDESPALPPALHVPVPDAPDLHEAPAEIAAALLPLALSLHRDPELGLLLQHIAPPLSLLLEQPPLRVQLLQLHEGTEPEHLLDRDEDGALRPALQPLDLAHNRWLDLIALVRQGGLTHVPRPGGDLLLLSPCRGCRAGGVALAIHLASTAEPSLHHPEQRLPHLQRLAQRLAFVAPLLAGVARQRRAEREHTQLRAENRYFRDRQRRHYLFKELVAESAAMRAVYARLSALVETPGPVLLTGDAGTGKELVARALHHLSPRKDGLLVAQGCEDADEDLLDLLLFGAAADPQSTRVGVFELADGGTLYLDDVEALPLRLQGRLLRVIKEGEIRRHGEDTARAVNVRVVASTRANLHLLAAQGLFRRDLLLAFQERELRIPGLHERPEDILPLLHIFLDLFAHRHGLPRPEIAASLPEALRVWPWPGNVRELQAAAEAALLKNTGQPLTAADLGIGG